MKGFCPLASGSKGNCIYLETEGAKILIDAGISGKATRERLEELDVDISTLDAIFVTHDHRDHIQGVKVLSNRYNLPIITNADTANGISSVFPTLTNFKIFTTGEMFTFKDIEVHPFRIQHDTADPVGFTINTMGYKLGFCTDIGFVTSLVKVHLQKCDYLYIESNHQPSMVHACPRPQTYKQRVLSRFGHLSNEDCGKLLKEIKHEELKHVHLAHLSEECNHPEVAMKYAKEALGENFPISIATQKKRGQEVLFSKQLA
jgi:phosphoribosyl 1,2-cyclic phosphodiesterase